MAELTPQMTSFLTAQHIAMTGEWFKTWSGLTYDQRDWLIATYHDTLHQMETGTYNAMNPPPPTPPTTGTTIPFPSLP